jgi:hypothetical protein
LSKAGASEVSEAVSMSNWQGSFSGFSFMNKRD